MLDDFAGAYGAEPATLWAEVLHQLRLRLRSIGFSHVGHGSRIAPATAKFSWVSLGEGAEMNCLRV